MTCKSLTTNMSGCYLMKLPKSHIKKTNGTPSQKLHFHEQQAMAIGKNKHFIQLKSFLLRMFARYKRESLQNNASDLKLCAGHADFFSCPPQCCTGNHKKCKIPRRWEILAPGRLPHKMQMDKLERISERRQNRSQTRSQVENQHFVRDFWLPPNTEFHTLKNHCVCVCARLPSKTDHPQISPFTVFTAQFIQSTCHHLWFSQNSVHHSQLRFSVLVSFTAQPIDNSFTIRLFKLMWRCAFIAFRIHSHVVNSLHPELVSSRVQFNQSSVHSQFESLTTQCNHGHILAALRGQFIHNPVLTQLGSFLQLPLRSQ